MALIPTDVGVNLRTQLDAPIRSAAPIAEVPSDLPDLRAGQRFTATIQQVLPDATYKALVAGKSVTLSLTEGAKSGDTLELVVVDKTPQTLLAKLAENDASTATRSEPYPQANLSPAGRLIGTLLPSLGEPPKPVALNQGQPLVPAEIMTTEHAASVLASQLQKSVSESGLFYEAHQAKWVAGQFPTEALLQEPQNRVAAPPAHLAPTLNVAPKESGAATPAPPATAAATPASSVPEELKTVVQHQLDAAASQRMVWHGEVWPQQTMEWAIHRDAEQRRSAQDPETNAWTTHLALTTPRLGRVEATLELRGNGLRVTVQAADAESVDALRQKLPDLASALEAAGIAPQAVQVRLSRHG